MLALYILGFVAIFYLVVMRPQQKQRKAHQELVSGVQRGDRVRTVGGIQGIVKRTQEDEVELEIANGVSVQLARQAIASIVESETSPVSELEESVDTEDWIVSGPGRCQGPEIRCLSGWGHCGA